MVTPVFDSAVKKEELFAQLDSMAANLSQTSLQFGWVAMELWNLTMEDFLQESEGKEKKALGAFITVVQEREAKDIDSRKTVADRIRIAKFVPRKIYEKMVSASGGIEPTYHQIRACIFTSFGELDEPKTGAMFDWCVANKWPAVADIRIQRGVIDPRVAVDPKERHFKQFVKLSQTIMAEFPSGPIYECAKCVLDTWKTENHLSVS
jgi:hypothetical protein